MVMPSKLWRLKLLEISKQLDHSILNKLTIPNLTGHVNVTSIYSQFELVHCLHGRGLDSVSIILYLALSPIPDSDGPVTYLDGATSHYFQQLACRRNVQLFNKDEDGLVLLLCLPPRFTAAFANSLPSDK